jgi:hypothetical protein
MFDHQVGFQVQFGQFAHGLNDHGANGQIRDKMTVHAIDMKTPYSCVFTALDVSGKIAKISGKDTG